MIPKDNTKVLRSICVEICQPDLAAAAKRNPKTWARIAEDSSKWCIEIEPCFQTGSTNRLQRRRRRRRACPPPWRPPWPRLTASPFLGLPSGPPRAPPRETAGLVNPPPPASASLDLDAACHGRINCPPGQPPRSAGRRERWAPGSVEGGSRRAPALAGAAEQRRWRQGASGGGRCGAGALEVASVTRWGR